MTSSSKDDSVIQKKKKNLPCNAGDMGLIPGQGTKILHVPTTESVHSRARAPQLESPCTTTTEPAHAGAHGPQIERSPCAAMKDHECRNKEPTQPH